jgi:hypothetical protein
MDVARSMNSSSLRNPCGLRCRFGEETSVGVDKEDGRSARKKKTREREMCYGYPGKLRESKVSKISDNEESLLHLNSANFTSNADERREVGFNPAR